MKQYLDYMNQLLPIQVSPFYAVYGESEAFRFDGEGWTAFDWNDMILSNIPSADKLDILIEWTGVDKYAIIPSSYIYEGVLESIPENYIDSFFQFGFNVALKTSAPYYDVPYRKERLEEGTFKVAMRLDATGWFYSAEAAQYKKDWLIFKDFE